MRIYSDSGEGACTLSSRLHHSGKHCLEAGNAMHEELGLHCWAEHNKHAHLQCQPEGLAASAGIGIVQAAPLRLQVQHLHVSALGCRYAGLQ